jgi:hypothetical protein
MLGGLGHGSAAQVRQQLAAAFAAGVDTVIADFTPAAFRSFAAEAVTAPNVFRVVISRHGLADFLAGPGPAVYWSLYPGPAPAPGTGHPNGGNAGRLIKPHQG